MSRVGNTPIEVPSGVTVSISGSRITAKGSRGEMELTVPPVLSLQQEDGRIIVKRKADHKQARSFHGLFARLINNILIGVSTGFSKRLEIIGVGYRAQMEGDTLVMQLGFSHPVRIEPPEGITLQVEGNQKVIVSGNDKQKVGQIAAKIRSSRPPEPYKGKGVRYEGEWVRRKAGKAMA